MKKLKRRLNSINFDEKRNPLAARLDFFRTVQQDCQSITDSLAELRNKSQRV